MWRATDPENNPAAAPGPTYMPDYRQPERVGLRPVGAVMLVVAVVLIAQQPRLR
jgi:hypothetical protein